MLDYELPGLRFNYDHGLSTGPDSCMCNFGIDYEADYGHSGHLTMTRRVLPDRPKAEWPLVFWDEEEQEGKSLLVRGEAWLSGWLARFAGWLDDSLAEHRDALVAAAEAAGDAGVAPVLDAILAGERGPGALLSLLAPESVMARAFTLAGAQGLELGRAPWSVPPDKRGEALAAWAPLIGADPLFNAPAAFAASLGFDTPRAQAWLTLNLKYDVGGSVGVADFTRAAARHLFEHAPDRDSPYWPILQGYSENKYIGGDPWCAVGRALLKAGELLAAITAFENAILFERGWSEEFHMEALEGIQKAAEKLKAQDFLEYLDAMGED